MGRDHASEQPAPSPLPGPVPAPPAIKAVRPLALLVGVALVPLNCYWVIITEVRWYSLDGSCLPLFVTPLFLLFVLAALSLALRRLHRALALSPAELIIIYIMVAVSSTVAGHDTLQNLFGAITYPLWHDHLFPRQRWNDLFFAYLPIKLLVWDVPALEAFHEGNSSWLTPEYVRAWAGPLAAWGLFFAAMLAVLFCASVLLRKPWSEHERLTFPIVQLPLALSQPEGLFRSRLMWVGFGLAFSLRLLAGMHTFYPELIYPALKYGEVSWTPSDAPLNAIGRVPFSFYPFMIGIAYFVPLDLSFSCWFFYLFRQLEVVLSAAAGWSVYRDMPYIPEQSSGAWVGMGLVLVWALRRQLGTALRGALTRNWTGDAGEPIRYRWAFAGMAVGLLVMGAFCMLAGMSLPLAVAFLAFWLVIALAITRVRVEFGSPHEIYFVNPSTNLVAILGVDVLGPRNLTGLSMMYWFNRCVRNHPMPNQLEAMKMAGTVGVMRTVVWAIALASIMSILSTYWAQLYQGYRDGASAKSQGFKYWLGEESFRPLAIWLRSGEEIRDPRRVAMLVGLGIVFVLRLVRERYVGWPFHPAGYALGISFALDYFWFTFFLGWLVKLALTHYGGIRAQRGAVPFFLGLILGDYVIGALWAIYGPLTGTLTYKIFI